MSETFFQLKKISELFNPPQETQYVAQNEKMRTALTIMIGYDFSQILVVRQRSSGGLRGTNVVGCLSWFSIGQKCMNRALCLDDPVIDYMESISDAAKFARVDSDMLLSDVASRLHEKEFLLAVDSRDVVLGFVTTYDISKVYMEQVAPYGGIQKIELKIRELLSVLSEEEIRKACESLGRARIASSVNELEFSEYVLMFSKYWEKIGLNYDREIFNKMLDKVRIARNKVMHFNTNLLDDSEKALINSFYNILVK